jgi:hypothetical protein
MLARLVLGGDVAARLTGGLVPEQAAQASCWLRASLCRYDGIVELFGARAAAEAYADRFARHARNAWRPVGTCLEGCWDRPADCYIKAIAGTRRYLLPGDGDYAQQIVIPGRGDRWFCTEAEALGDGWHRRPS